MKDFRSLTVSQRKNILDKINNGVETVCMFYGLERYLKEGYTIEINWRITSETVIPPLKYIDITAAKGNIKMSDDYYIEQSYPLYHTLYKIIKNIKESKYENITEDDFKDINRAIKYINDFKLIPKINMFDVETERIKMLNEIEKEDAKAKLSRTLLQSQLQIQ